MFRSHALRRTLTVAVVLAASVAGTVAAAPPASAAPVVLAGPRPVPEGAAGTGRNVQFTITLPADAVGNEKVTVQTIAGSASHGDLDYRIVKPTVVSFVAGERSRTIAVRINGDDKPEITEFFKLRFSSPVNLELPAVAEVSATITDDDWRINIDDATVTEQTGSTTTIGFVVGTELEQAAPCTYTATLTHITTAPGDFSGPSTVTVTQPVNGFSMATFTVVGDAVFEGTETFSVTIAGSGAKPCRLGRTVAAGAINDDDPPQPPLTIADAGRTEQDGGGGFVLHFPITGFTAPCGYRAAIDFGTTDLNDFTGSPAVVNTRLLTAPEFAAIIKGDSDIEPDETFTMTLTGAASGANPACNFADGVAVGTILDDDAPVQIFLDDLTVAEGQIAAVPVRFEQLRGRFCRATYTTVSDTATANVDFQGMSITQGFFDSPGLVKVAGINDTDVEGAESYFVDAVLDGGQPKCELVDSRAVVTITDDDVASATISIADRSKIEGTGVDANHPFAVSTTGVLTAPCTYTATLTHGTTDAGDFTAIAAVTRTQPISGAVTNVPFKVVGDAVAEPDETFTVTIVGSGANPCPIADGTALGTIRNDD